MTGRRLIECLRALSPEELELPVILDADDNCDRLNHVQIALENGKSQFIELTVDWGWKRSQVERAGWSVGNEAPLTETGQTCVGPHDSGTSKNPPQQNPEIEKGPMSKITRKRFFAWMAGAVGLAGYAVAKSSAPSSGVLVIEFDPRRFPHGKDGTYHAGIVKAVDRIANGREIFQVAGQCIFPVYGRDGYPTFMATVILLPDGFHPNGDEFANFPKVRWLGGGNFERV